MPWHCKLQLAIPPGVWVQGTLHPADVTSALATDIATLAKANLVRAQVGLSLEAPAATRCARQRQVTSPSESVRRVAVDVVLLELI